MCNKGSGLYETFNLSSKDGLKRQFVKILADKQHMMTNKNEITFLRGDMDREFKGD